MAADLNGDADTTNGTADQVDEQDTSTVLTNGVNGDGNGHSNENGHHHDHEHVHSHDDQNAGALFQIFVKLPHHPYKMTVMVTNQEQVQDVRQSIVESPDTFQYTCFHLEHNGEKINDFVELSEVKDLKADSELVLVEDPYTEKEARMHVVRIRELIGAAGDRADQLHGLCAGMSLHDVMFAPDRSAATSSKESEEHPLAEYDFNGAASTDCILPKKHDVLPKTIKGLSISPWNPPPYHLRQRGHLLYLLLTTNEGEQHQITCAISGFFVSKSSNNKFDPFPRPAPKNHSAHSLLSLISLLSPAFNTSFVELQKLNGQKDLLTTFPFQNAIPANPWIVPSIMHSSNHHQPDATRAQEAYLVGGVDGAENLRDWNEEFQTTRELPRESLQDRVFRERLNSKLFADYNDAAARGAVLVARGEVAPLNPTEGRDAQIFIYNNIFFSFGADGVQTFASEGGDEAARVAVGKDVTGVQAVNQLDIHGLYTPGTVVVDYLGKRIVGQSIVPGIFKQREPGEHQIDYGGVEGRDVVTENPAFVPVFEKLSKALRVKKHAVWDKEGKRHYLEGSVETKGLLGTDGRKYVLDLYRIAPLDVAWSEEVASPEGTDFGTYPHRMAILRTELVESYWRMKMQEYVKAEVEKKRAALSKGHSEPAATPIEAGDLEPKANGHTETEGNENTKSEPKETSEAGEKKGVEANGDTKKDDLANDPERVDISNFNLALNPDVCSGQIPQSDEEKAEYADDEKDVRAVCEFLREKVLKGLISDLDNIDVGFPMDGLSLSQLMHKRGLNIRYLGKLTTLALEKGQRLQALSIVATQEMVTRAFKHIMNRYLRHLPALFATSCISHLINCLLGTAMNPKPTPEIDEDFRSFYPDGDFSFEKLTPESLVADIEGQVKMRYRYALSADWQTSLKPLQILREICLRQGLQLAAKDYMFTKEVPASAEGSPTPSVDGASQTNGSHHEESKKKKKKAVDHSQENGASTKPVTTFTPEDILNINPIVKDAAPKSILAEEALEAGRLSLAQNQKQLGQELVLESLSLHEQIYGILHPEVARMYYQLSMIYYQTDEKEAAVELARKAVIVTERTLGVDSHDTVLAYLNLALFEHHVGNTKQALRYVRHALDVWKIIFGPNHPDSITTMNNAAVMLQSLKQYGESRRWFEACVQVCGDVFGPQSVNSATILFQLAQALALDGDAKAAVNRMRDAYNIFHAELGPSDRNTKEAESWLEQLTQNAVSIAKQAKDLQNRRFRRVQYMPRMGLGTRLQPQVGQMKESATSVATAPATSQPRGIAPLDSRSIDELLKWIEGGESVGSSPRAKQKKRAKAMNPKLRRAQEVAEA
jgi:protein TIF31